MLNICFTEAGLIWLWQVGAAMSELVRWGKKKLVNIYLMPAPRFPVIWF